MQQLPPPSQEPQWPSAAMASARYDHMFPNSANHISRSELLRRFSNRSNSTSGSSKRGSARVTKQTSASNSPSHVQRRRTTANHTARSYPRASQENAYETREQRLRNYHSSKQPVPSPRPMSWHPGSNTFHSPNAQTSTSRPALGNTIAGLENLAVSDTSASSVQQSIRNAFALGCNLSTPPQAPSYEPSTAAELQSYEPLGPNSSPEYDSYPTYSISDHVQYPYMPHSMIYDMYPSSTYQSAQQWPQHSSYYPISSPAPPEVPEYQPPRFPVNPARKVKATSAPQLSRRKSKELIGMGLYDDKRSNFLSDLDSAASEVAGQESVGKGLKLEETWQPPNEDEEEIEDEGYSTEEAEEVEEAPQTTMPSSEDTQTAVYPTYADMSNQSFFFNDDDDYSNENQYANYLAYSQQWPGGQPKPQSNPVMENYLWL